MSSWVATAAGGLVSSVTLKYSHSPHIYSVLTAENVYVYSRKNLISNWKITFHNVSCHIVRHSVKGIGTNIRSILILILILKTVRYWFVISKMIYILNVFKCRLCAESQVYNTCMTGNYRKCNWLSVCNRQDNIDFLLLRITVSSVLVWLQSLQGWTS